MINFPRYYALYKGKIIPFTCMGINVHDDGEWYMAQDGAYHKSCVFTSKENAENALMEGGYFEEE